MCWQAEDRGVTIRHSTAPRFASITSLRAQQAEVRQSTPQARQAWVRCHMPPAPDTGKPLPKHRSACIALGWQIPTRGRTHARDAQYVLKGRTLLFNGAQAEVMGEEIRWRDAVGSLQILVWLPWAVKGSCRALLRFLAL